MKGLVDIWGVINDINLITKQNTLPTIIFHGMLDRVCPYGVDHFYSCPQFPPSYGALPVYERLMSLKVPVIANIDPDGSHGVYTTEFRAKNIGCFVRALMSGNLKSGFYTEGEGNCP